jgi:uncharacterized protein YxjI
VRGFRATQDSAEALSADGVPTSTLQRGDDVVATVSKKRFRMRETYAVEIAEGKDAALLLSLTDALDAMSRR